MLKKSLFVLLAIMLLVPFLITAGCAPQDVIDDVDDADDVELTDERLTLTLSYPTGNVPRERNAEIIQQYLAEIGIEIVLDIQEFGTLVPQVYEEQDFDLYLMGWSLALDPDPAGIWLSTDAWNSVNFDHPDNDRLIMAGKATLDQDERIGIYEEWQRLLVEEAPYVWFHAETEAWVSNPRIANFSPDSFDPLHYVWEWEAVEGQDQVVIAIWSAPEGKLNPNLSESVYDVYSYEPVFAGLMRYDPRNNYELDPEVARSMEISDDNLTITFELRDDVFFHDGVQLTAEDVKFTFEWMCHPDYTGVRASYWADFVGFEEYNSGEADNLAGVEVVDDFTVVFNLAQVDAPVLGRLATWGISPKHVFEGYSIADLGLGHPAVINPIGAGPFKFVRYVEGQFAEMEAYDDYLRGRPALDRIIVKVASADVAQAELVTGETDIAWVQPDLRDFELYESEGLIIQEMPANAYQYMGIQTDHPILSDKLVRHAITYALDRQAMVDNLFDGLALEQVSHMSSVSWAYDPTLEPLAFDPDKAAELLDEAGWRLGPDGYRYRVAE